MAVAVVHARKWKTVLSGVVPANGVEDDVEESVQAVDAEFLIAF